MHIKFKCGGISYGIRSRIMDAYNFILIIQEEKYLWIVEHEHGSKIAFSRISVVEGESKICPQMQHQSFKK